MSTPRPVRPARALARRTRAGGLSALVVASATASAVVVTLLGSRYSARWDVTATAEHTLSPLTRRTLDRLEGDYEIVAALDPAATDAAARRAARDVLAEFEHASPAVRSTEIDTTSAAGQRRFDELLDRLTDREADGLRESKAAVEAAAAGLEELAGYFDSTLGPGLRAVGEALPEEAVRQKRNFANNADLVSTEAGRLRASAARARDRTAGDGPALALALSDAARELSASYRPMADALALLARELDAIAKTETVPESVRAAAGPLAGSCADRRDAAARAGDALARQKPLQLARVARALERGAAVLVIGPPEAGLTAIDPATLYPFTDPATGAASELRRNAEDLFTIALASLADPERPIVVVVHGEPRLLLRSAEPFGAVIDRLTLRGMDVVEWPAAVEPDPPPLADLDPAGTRPVVYVVHNTDTSVRGDAGPESTGAARAGRLGEALRRIIDDGRPVLMSVCPSTLPAAGQADPTIGWLPLFGLSADSGRPIVQESVSARGRVMSPDHRARAPADGHEIGGALAGLPVVLPWPTGLSRVDPPVGVMARVWPILEVSGPGLWAESQWLAALQTPPERWSQLASPPAPDSPRDQPGDRFLVAAAAERTDASRAGSQRLVVVSANGWFANGLVEARAVIDGRPTALAPGNAELFEAAVLWLAGMDDRVAASPTARATPVIGAIDPGRLGVLRLALIIGMPLAVLAAGVAWRVARG